eukprot:Opistho-1_new@649
MSRRTARVVVGEEEEEESGDEVTQDVRPSVVAVATTTHEAPQPATQVTPTATRRSGTAASARIVSGEGDEGEESESGAEDEFVDAAAALPNDGGGVAADSTPEGALGGVEGTSDAGSVATAAGSTRTGVAKRIYERNAALRVSVSTCVQQQYRAAARHLAACSSLLARSQGIVQDSDYQLRRVGDEFAALTSRLDIVTSYEIIPEIVIPSTQ